MTLPLKKFQETNFGWNKIPQRKKKYHKVCDDSCVLRCCSIFKCSHFQAAFHLCCAAFKHVGQFFDRFSIKSWDLISLFLEYDLGFGWKGWSRDGAEWFLTAAPRGHSSLSPFLSLSLFLSVSLSLALSPRMLTLGDWPPFTEGAPAGVEWKRAILIIMLILTWFVPTIKHKWGRCVSFLSKTMKPAASPFSCSKQGVQLGSSQMVEFPPVWVLEKKEANTCSRPWLFNP